MTADALRRLQALRGLTRTGSAHTVLAQVQGDLQTVIEVVLDLAGHDDEHPTEEPAVGEQVTDATDFVWQRFEDGWRLWVGGAGSWSSTTRTRDYVQAKYGPLRETTDDDRRRVGLPVPDEDASPTPAQTAAQPEEPESEPENAAQGRIGWLRLKPDERRHLAQEIPGGWNDTDEGGDSHLWSAEDWPDAEFEPIRTLADDEVAVKREDAEAAIEVAEHLRSGLVPDRSIRRTATSVLQGMADALEAGR